MSSSINWADLRSQDASSFSRAPSALGWSAIALTSFGFCFWSIFAPLASAVFASGVVVIDGGNKTLQSPEPGVVSAIFVRDGESVTAGQYLLKLDNSQQMSALKALAREICLDAVHQARLRAEQADSPMIVYPTMVHGIRLAEFPDVVADENQDFKVKRDALTLHEDEIKSEQAGVKATVAGLDDQVTALVARQSLARQSLSTAAQLSRDGIGSRKAVRESLAEAASLAGELAETTSRRIDLQHQVTRLSLEALRLRVSYKETNNVELQKLENEQQELFQRYDQSNISLDRTLIRSPAAGEVMNLAVHTIGGVVLPGVALLEIVPRDAPLVIETRIKPTDIRDVKVGSSVLVRAEGEGSRQTAMIEGIVASVTADRLTDRETDDAFFLVRLTVNRRKFVSTQGIDLRPGASMTVMIMKESKSLLSYLAWPVIESFSHSLKE